MREYAQDKHTSSINQFYIFTYNTGWTQLNNLHIYVSTSTIYNFQNIAIIIFIDVIFKIWYSRF